MAESKVTSKYQITVPKDIRKKLDLKEGDQIIFLPYKDKILLEKKEKSKLAKELPLKIKAEKVEDVHVWREIAKKRARDRIS